MDLQAKLKSMFFSTFVMFAIVLLFLFNYQNFENFSKSYISTFSFNSNELERSFANINEHHGLEKFFLSETTNVLVLGTDAPTARNYESFNGRTDFMMLLSLNNETKKVKLINIPRDTYLDVNKYGFSRINFANSVGGINKVKETVSKLLGMEVDHYVMVNIDAFKKILKEFGPIKIYVPKEMHYEDRKAGLHIDFEPGLESMDANELIEFLRYRDNKDGDIGRIKRQQIFFRALIHQLSFQDLMLRLPYVFKIMSQICLTDLNFETCFNLAKSFSVVFQDGFESFILPGDFGSNGYWIIDNKAMKSLLQYIRTE